METVDEVVDSMDRFAGRHWMHEEVSQPVREFAARLREAYRRLMNDMPVLLDDFRDFCDSQSDCRKCHIFKEWPKDNPSCIALYINEFYNRKRKEIGEEDAKGESILPGPSEEAR